MPYNLAESQADAGFDLPACRSGAPRPKQNKPYVCLGRNHSASQAAGAPAGAHRPVGVTPLNSDGPGFRGRLL